MPPRNQIMGSEYLDANHMASTKFLGVYRENSNLRAYQFYFEVGGEIVQELLPFSGAFGLPGKNTWVLSPKEFHALRVEAGRAPAPEETLLRSSIMIKLGMMTSCGEARDGMTTVKPINTSSTSSRRSSPTCSHSRDTTTSRGRSTTPW
jgi:hypothetical protein